MPSIAVKVRGPPRASFAKRARGMSRVSSELVAGQACCGKLYEQILSCAGEDA
jgi:hypothetical protein